MCSIHCTKGVKCLVTEAARATSAAPTFFSAQRIGDRYFVDGGMDFNNPSWAMWEHYTQSVRTTRIRRLSKSSVEMPAGATSADHEPFDFSRTRIVNLGTGTKSDALPSRQRDRLASLVPGFIRMSLFLKKTLTEIAVNSELIASMMRSLDEIDTNISYHRFSADNGVCFIKMDKYKQLDIIDKLTKEYLNNHDTQKSLERLGEAIAKEYLDKIYLRTTVEQVIPVTSTATHFPTGPDQNGPLENGPSSL